jgi:hypothetical protein
VDEYSRPGEGVAEGGGLSRQDELRARTDADCCIHEDRGTSSASLSRTQATLLLAKAGSGRERRGLAGTQRGADQRTSTGALAALPDSGMIALRVRVDDLMNGAIRTVERCSPP